ncbi:MAG: hypothetical protein C4522_17710 [Desulfobacteraceae bacterium]|nr:MAG: hypothetical protein C4522_17710 [Desulfobacteraceae bacterium]
MNRIPVVLCAAMLLIPACTGNPLIRKVPPGPEAEVAACMDCHSNVDELFSKEHPAVSGDDIRTCFSCHQPMDPKKAEPNTFSATLHRAHLNKESGVDCLSCHSWIPGRHFGISGTGVDLGPLPENNMPLLKKTFLSWAGSRYLDARHAKQNVTCSGCHGDSLPAPGDTIKNERCLMCHGSYDALAEKTVPEIFPDRNPHQSHLGVIDCTVCHVAHGESRAYCLECHQKFVMKTPG